MIKNVRMIDVKKLTLMLADVIPVNNVLFNNLFSI